MPEIFNIANYSYNLISVPYIICGLLTLFFGIFVFSANRRSLINIGYSLMTVNMFVWMFFLGIVQLANNPEIRMFWLLIEKSFGAIFIAASMYCFSVGWLGASRQKKFILPSYLLFIPFAVLFWIPGAMYEKIIQVGSFFGYPYFYFYNGTVYFWILISLWLFFALLALYNLYRAVQVKNLSLPELKRRKLIFYIFFLGYLGFVEWLPFFKVKMVTFGYIPVFLMAVIFAFYGILKYSLFDIKLIIKKAFFYSVGIALISGVIFGISFLNSWFAEHISGFRFWMVPVFAGIVAFIVGKIFYNKSKEVDKLKYEFITVAAHKLRTPLTEIKWAANALDESNLDSEQKKLTTGISSANTRLITLTDELLSIAKTEAGQYQYKFEPVDFEKMVRSIVNDYQRQMQEKGIKLNYDYDKNTPKANVDKIRMSMVVQILLENAIAYTPSADGTISINIKKDKNDILFSIKDNGIGISKEDLLYIFSRFYRTHEAYATETEGSGLGLYLAKSITDKHNAKIGVNSEGQGKGSEFWVRVKLS